MSAADNRYNHSGKGFARYARYDASEKGRARHTRYDWSEKGQARRWRAMKAALGARMVRQQEQIHELEAYLAMLGVGVTDGRPPRLDTGTRRSYAAGASTQWAGAAQTTPPPDRGDTPHVN